MAVVFQGSLLFPHLGAVDSVAYGLRVRGARKAGARKLAEGWLERVGLAADHLTSRRSSPPARVALAGPSPPNRRCCCSTSRCPQSA